MASCTQIKYLIQAYLDDELGQAQRVILEQHAANCAACSHTLAQHKASSATVYEVMSEHRLTHDLTSQIMGHLPEMMYSPDVVTESDWRAKHPYRLNRLFINALPAFAIVLLIVLGFALFRAWPPADSIDAPVIGMVTQTNGQVLRSRDDSFARQDVALRSVIKPSETFETNDESGLMLSLAGASELKVAENTRLKINGTRDISLVKGRAWFSVGKDSQGQLFRVGTPQARVTVYGTVFGVEVVNGGTVVTVEEGEVQVEELNEFGQNGTTVLVADEEVRVDDPSTMGTKRSVRAEERLRWAKDLRPDVSARQYFLATIGPRGGNVIPGERVFIVRNRHKNVAGFTFTWEPDLMRGHAGYHVYVYQDAERLLHTSHIPGNVFDDLTTSQYPIVVPEDSGLAAANALHIHLVPDYSYGQRQVSIDVSALIIP